MTFLYSKISKASSRAQVPMVSPPTEVYASTPPLYQPPHSTDPRPQPDPIDPLQVFPACGMYSCDHLVFVAVLLLTPFPCSRCPCPCRLSSPLPPRLSPRPFSQSPNPCTVESTLTLHHSSPCKR